MPPPEVQEARGLDAAQLAAIGALEQRVVDHDGGRLKLEWGTLESRPKDRVTDLLVWDGPTLAGFCGIYDFGTEPELAGAVDPAHRRRGVGTALLTRAADLLRARGRPSVLLVTPRATDAGRRFAEALRAPFHHAEHHMELNGPPAGPPPPRPSTEGLHLRAAAEADRDTVVRIIDEAFGGGATTAGVIGPTDFPLVVERGGVVLGALRLSLEAETAGVYGFAVASALRGRGIGRAALYEACLEARRRGAQKVHLEVEVDNDRALGLYTSVGFELVTTEDYFRLSLAGA